MAAAVLDGAMNRQTSTPAGQRAIRSFVRRQGRMTAAQKDALQRLWPRYGLEAPPAPLQLPALFGREAPVSLEIGFGAGHHLLARAAAEGGRDFIGVEVHRPGAGRVLMHAEALGLRNVRVACVDAVEVLHDWIELAALDEIIVEFPDPWHKKRHHKRRLVQPPFVRLAASRLRRGGRLRLATDWAEYAEQMLQVLRAEPALRNAAPGGAYAARPASRPPTRFEQRGQRLGHAVFDLEFCRVEGGEAAAAAGSGPAPA